MKKSFILILTCLIVVFVILLSNYYKYRDKQNEIKEFNLQYEEYLDKEIYGTEIATVINKAVDSNETNLVEKNDINYINIEIKIIDLEEDMIYDMETLYNGGIVQFVEFYNSILFKCIHIDYNSEGRVKYLLFEQITQ